MDHYELAVIGGGPGGYVAAIRAGSYGLKTVLIEEKDLGGTCLNRGCVPTKAMLHSCEVLENIKRASEFGISVEKPRVDITALYGYKDRVVSQLKSGVERLLKANGVKILKAKASFKDANTLKCTGSEGEFTVAAENIILASGSVPSIPPIQGLEGVKFWTSETLLEQNLALPESMTIIGGGVIGVECANILNDLGVKVVVLEMLPQLLPNMDADIAEELKNRLQKDGITIKTGVKVLKLSRNNKIETVIESANGQETVYSDEVMIAAGRRSRLDGLNLESAGIAAGHGIVITDKYMRTNQSHIYAIGDVSGGIQLAHAASAQGLAAVDAIAGKTSYINQEVVPSCVYTRPEISSAGKTEKSAAAEGLKTKCGVFPLIGNSKSIITGENSGFVKIVSDADTGAVIGGQMIGPRATELISEIALAISSELTVEELSSTIHPHPTVSESVMECAHDIEGLSVHKMPGRK